MFWRVRLAEPAQQDFAAILYYTRDTFGVQQAEIYEDRIITSLEKLEEGPHVAGSMLRNAMLQLYTLHITLGGRRGRHFIAYRPVGNDVIEVLRILHDASDLERHVSEWMHQ